MEEWGWEEMEGAEVRDRRCRKSLATICDRVAAQPEAAFSTACGPTARKAAYRIFSFPETTPEGLLAGHQQQAIERGVDEALLLFVQDTTSVNYTTHPDTTGLGPIGSGPARGLFVHSVIAVTPRKQCLGVIHQQIWARDPEASGSRSKRRQRTIEEKESRKWLGGLRATERALAKAAPDGRRALLIQDREADVFAFLAAPRRPGLDLLVRATQPRSVETEDGRERRSLVEAAQAAPRVGTRTVGVPRRPGQRAHPVELSIHRTTVRLQPPRHRKAGDPADPIEYTLIRATEIAPPEGEEAIEWILLTTLAVEDGEAASRIVGYYECRWVIERVHFVLKSGLRIERLQINEGRSLGNAIALLSVVAWRLLWLTHEARVDPEQPAENLLSEEAIEVLGRASGKAVTTAREAVRGVAKLGGFEGAPSAGEPGVKTLWIGLRRLEAMIEGYRLAHRPPLPRNRSPALPTSEITSHPTPLPSPFRSPPLLSLG